ncbi:MAG: class I SAM-dependent methyltransferase [Pseudomonadota bacterium]
MAGNGSEDSHFGSAYSLETPEQTKAYYKSWADTYDREVSEDGRYAQPQRVADMFVRHLRDRDALILDAGCGSGLSGAALAGVGYTNLHGCDFSPEMLTKASEKNVYRMLFEADLNAPQSDIVDCTYDAIACVGVLSFGHVQVDVLDEFLRILKPSGLIVIAVNEPFWETGTLPAKVDALEASGSVQVLAKELGEHMPTHDVKGWVIALRRPS